MPAPAVSVVMPVYNGSRFLDRAVASLRAQTFPDWELIAVDDASTDDSAARLDAQAETDPRVCVFRHSTNRGPSAARNTALQKARGKWIAYLDCDDEFYPDHLARATDSEMTGELLIFTYDVLEERPDALGVGAAYRHDPAALRTRLLAFGNIATPLGVAHRRDLIDRVRPFDERLRFEEDAELWRRMARSGPNRPRPRADRGGTPLVSGRTRVDVFPRRSAPHRRAAGRDRPLDEQHVEATLFLADELFLCRFSRGGARGMG